MADSNFLFLNAHEAMLRAGIEVDEIYRRLGIDAFALLQPGTRIPHQGQVPFWATVEAVTGDKEIGLHLCRHLSPLAGEFVNTLFMHSATVGAGIDQFLRHLRLVSDHVALRMIVQKDRDEVRIAGRLGDQGMPRHSEIMLAWSCLQALMLATTNRFRLIRFDLQCAASSHPGEFEELFGCPVHFGQQESSFVFHRSMLDLPLLHADPDMEKANHVVAQKRMRQVQRQNTIEEVRSAVLDMLTNEPPTLDLVARELGRSPRTLRSELQDAGTNFNQVVSEVQQIIAKRLLAGTTMPLDDIVSCVGFSERSAFYRAFRRWTGLTPLQYRQKRQGS